jgi:glycerophosphoryl diester phosphodiesterase
MKFTMFLALLLTRPLGTGEQEHSRGGLQRLMTPTSMGIELDVQLSADGVPFVFHETYLDGHTTGKGRASSKTWAELNDLQLIVDGKPFSLSYSGTAAGSQRLWAQQVLVS